VLCTVLVHLVGTVGAAVSAFLTGVVVLGASTREVRRRMHVTLDGRRLGQVAVALVVTGAGVAILVAVGLPWPLTVVAATVPYAVLLGRFGFHSSIREAFA
jgi:hypothetical protein